MPESRHPVSGELSIPVAVPAELVDVLADLVAARLAERRAAEAEPYVGVAEAAEYLACARARVYELVRRDLLPHHRDGARLLFRRRELDAYLAAGGARRRPRLVGREADA